MSTSTRDSRHASTRDGPKAHTSTAKVKRGAERVRHNRAFRWFARTGLLARAVVYLVLGGLILQIAASGHGSSRADAEGAFAEVRHQPAGAEILVLLAVGLAAYAAWRFVEASSARPQGQRIPPWTRIGWLAAGGLYVVFCVSVIRIIAGAGANQGPEQHPSSLAADVLHLPGGPFVLGLAAAAIAGGGIGFMVWAARHDYSSELRSEQMKVHVRSVTRWSGVIGNAARGVAVFLVASSLFGSAVSDDPARAKSLDGALHTLARSTGGAVLLGIVGAGFLAFGLHSVLEARFRRV